jgi:hypothetical protein
MKSEPLLQLPLSEFLASTASTEREYHRRFLNDLRENFIPDEIYVPKEDWFFNVDVVKRGDPDAVKYALSGSEDSLALGPNDKMKFIRENDGNVEFENRGWVFSTSKYEFKGKTELKKDVDSRFLGDLSENVDPIIGKNYVAVKTTSAYSIANGLYVGINKGEKVKVLGVKPYATGMSLITAEADNAGTVVITSFEFATDFLTEKEYNKRFLDDLKDDDADPEV